MLDNEDYYGTEVIIIYKNYELKILHYIGTENNTIKT